MQFDTPDDWAGAVLPPNAKPRLSQCDGPLYNRLEYHEALAYVASNIDQFAIHRRGVDGMIGERIDSIVVLTPGDKISFALMPMLFGMRGPHGTAVVCANARGLLYADAPGFRMRRWILSCPAMRCWRVWIEELDGPADPLEAAV